MAMQTRFPRRLPPQSPIVTASTGIDQLGGMALQLQLSRFEPVSFWRENDESGFISVGPYYFSAHHFAPYPGWKQFKEVAIYGESTYSTIAEPSAVERVGLRYINEINLPQKNLLLNEYFDFYPFFGQDIAEDIWSFDCAIQVPFEDGKDSLLARISSLPSNEEGGARIKLDFDYSSEKPGELLDAADWLDKAYEHISRTFESCIKEPVRALFR